MLTAPSSPGERSMTSHPHQHTGDSDTDERIAEHEAEQQRQLLREADVMGLRLEPDYVHGDKYIVWAPGIQGFCDLVSVDECTCPRFRLWGRCPHHALVVDTVRMARLAALRAA